MRQVRKGKALKTGTVDNDDSPVFTEELGNTMRFVIDDPKKQRVRVLVKDEDLIMDTTVGYVEIPLKVGRARPLPPTLLAFLLLV